jgi:hypothetical protein
VAADRLLTPPPLLLITFAGDEPKLLKKSSSDDLLMGSPDVLLAALLEMGGLRARFAHHQDSLLHNCPSSLFVPDNGSHSQ